MLPRPRIIALARCVLSPFSGMPHHDKGCPCCGRGPAGCSLSCPGRTVPLTATRVCYTPKAILAADPLIRASWRPTLHKHPAARPPCRVSPMPSGGRRHTTQASRQIACQLLQCRSIGNVTYAHCRASHTSATRDLIELVLLGCMGPCINCTPVLPAST